jgi:hypothetical protein
MMALKQPNNNFGMLLHNFIQRSTTIPRKCLTTQNRRERRNVEEVLWYVSFLEKKRVA